MKKILALILAILMLCSAVSVAAFAEDAPAGDTPADDAIDWEAMYARHGINVYIGAATDTPPVVDGVISTAEYTFERVIPYVNLHESGSKGEIQSELKEYFAHDTNYIYIGAQFEQKNDNRAYWIQWKPFNDFDIFNGNTDLNKYYYQRVSAQVRYLATGEVTTKTDSNPNGGFGWTRGCDTPKPTFGTEDDKEYRFAGTKIVDETTATYTKTIEVRIAKSYIANVARCTLDEVRVVPYWTSFHANLLNCAPLSDELAVEIYENKLDAYVPGDPYTYWFLVCDEAPEGYTPVVGLPYDAPADDGGNTDGGDVVPPTTEATTTEATTTAAATTTVAATTTAAATEEEKSGCGSSLAVSALAILPTIAGGALLLKRRKED